MMQSLCSAGKTGPEYLLEWAFIKAVSCAYVDSSSIFVVGLLVFSPVALSIYIRTGSVMIPLGLAMMTGGVVMSVIPGIATQWVGVIVLLAGAGTITYVVYRYSR